MNPDAAQDRDLKELEADELAAVTGGGNVPYKLGFVLGALDAMVVDAYEAVFGNIPGL